MQEARRAAKRVDNITRVFILDSMRDLDNPVVLKQVRDDITAGLVVYTCLRADVAKELHAEPDFGIWDNEYVCVVNFDEKNQATHARLSSLKKDIDEANEWKQKILRHATAVKTLNDLRALLVA